MYFVGWIKRSGSTRMCPENAGFASLDPAYNTIQSPLSINFLIVQRPGKSKPGQLSIVLNRLNLGPFGTEHN